ncbi:DUF2262 domain-containing protein [Nostoc flagelliforme FACHB-838]|uniref:DUF2262 domain-containing protein n=1 Tax=Nostoc flagelliforme FACHB-838 TaxID=2692904 RepID=A0ABR8E0F1_9NOSO|nr:DUF2262 domain-containing protein [Nostoc flagelliforme FACHB-838]
MDKNINLPNIKHEILGELQYNNEFNCYENQVVFDEKQLLISLSVEDNAQVESILTRASIIVRNLKHYAKNAEEYAVKKLLELKNEAWLDEDEAFLTSEEFKNLMILE